MQHNSPIARVVRDIYLSRILTRSGDQAWDFAVPLTLVSMFASGVQAAALYFLSVRMGQVLLAPKIGILVDKWPRIKTIRVGIGTQVTFMLAGVGILYMLSQKGSREISSTTDILWFSAMIFTGLMSTLGSLITDIAVANDIIPTVVPAENLPTVNARLHQIDLATEVSSPIAAGLMLAASPAHLPLLGFTMIALWNVLSFFPEYRLLQSVLKICPKLQTKKYDAPVTDTTSLGKKLVGGWSAFLRQPAMPSMAAYALLWLSVLSPHGILLAAYLKKGWGISESALGIFRGAGALCGLTATYLYPKYARKFGMVGATRGFILFQAVTVILAVVFFCTNSDLRYASLCFILLSRIGLYGFSVGEIQIRQLSIAENERGRVNGFASALTSIATLGLYGAGTFYADIDQFHILVYTSGIAVGIAALVFCAWSISPSGGFLYSDRLSK